VNTKIFAFSLPVLLLSACADDAQEVAQDQMENTAEQTAIVAGAEPAALGLTELQLLDADVFGAAGVELGDVQRIMRDASGQVTGLLVEIEDSNPDRYVELPLEGMTVTQRGDDTDISTTLTRDQLIAMPEIDITTV